jgi:hypothetical protein
MMRDNDSDVAEDWLEHINTCQQSILQRLEALEMKKDDSDVAGARLEHSNSCQPSILQRLEAVENHQEDLATWVTQEVEGIKRDYDRDVLKNELKESLMASVKDEVVTHIRSLQELFHTHFDDRYMRAS